MKISTVLAAAFAAGLTTFAANAQELGYQSVSLGFFEPQALMAISRKAADDQITTVGTKPVATRRDSASNTKDDDASVRGLTGEEVFHAAAAAVKPEDRFKPIIERYASENGVSIELAHAVITVESNYRVYSLGKAGEVGLMQIKPTTAAMMGYSGSKNGLFDPETNIKYGMKYLGKAQRLGDGTTCGTILKYNAGHAAKRMNPTSKDYCAKVKRHIADARTVMLDLFGERKFGRGV